MGGEVRQEGELNSDHRSPSAWGPPSLVTSKGPHWLSVEGREAWSQRGWAQIPALARPSCVT